MNSDREREAAKRRHESGEEGMRLTLTGFERKLLAALIDWSLSFSVWLELEDGDSREALRRILNRLRGGDGHR